MTIILHDVVLFFPASPHYVEKQNVFDFDMSENTSIDTLNTTNASLNQQNLSLSSSGNFRPSSISFFSNIIISTQTETGRCEVFAVSFGGGYNGSPCFYVADDLCEQGINNLWV